MTELLGPTSRYLESAPPPSLADHLVCTWTQAIGAGETAYLQRVLPDGCADIVWIGEAAPVVVGPATRTVIAPLPAGAVVVGARFRPGAAPCLLGPPASDLSNREVPLLDLWGPAAGRIAARPGEPRGAEARLAILAAALAARARQARRPDPVAVAAVFWLARHPAGRVRELSRSIGISGRQLQRRFRAAVGYGPKTFQRILRFQRLLALAGNATVARPDLAALASDAGYADQAHMSREVRALADRSPGALLSRAASTLAMSDLFKTPGAPTP